MNDPANESPLRSFEWFHFEPVRRQGRRTLKELREILRDRRTIVTLILMPLLLYPLLSIALQQFFLSEVGVQGPPEYRIGFESARDAEFIQAYFQLGDLARGPVRRPGDPPPNDSVAKDQPNDSDPQHNGSAPTAANPQPLLQLFQTQDLRTSVRNLDLDLGIRLAGDVPTVIDPKQDLAIEVELLHRPDFAPSRRALEVIQEKLRASNAAFLRIRLRMLGVTQRPLPAKMTLEEIEPPVAHSSGVSLMTVLPLILILMTITGAVYPAIDLTAGERERGTLEILVAAPVSRMSLLFAKYVAVLTVAMLTATVNLGTMTVTVLVSGLGPVLFGDAGLSFRTVLEVFCLLLLFAAFFSSLLLALTSFARSFKEAQAYLIPLMLVSMAPGMMSILPGLELTGIVTVAPLMNIVLLARDLFQGTASAVSAAVVVISTLLYAGAAIGLAARIFGAEDVLYGDYGGWSALWHRPVEPRDTPSVGGAMGCLAVMFPGFFLLNSMVALLGGEGVAPRLALASLATVLLFVGVPLLAAKIGWIRLKSAFHLRPAPATTFIAAVLLGLSLWPLAHEIVVWKIELGLVEINHLIGERVEEMLERIRELPVALVLFCLAVVPAVCEEFFFRGFLFSALRSQTGPRTTIVASALIFGLFHLIVTDRLAFERFVPSTMMGVVLGWICWRSASVLPGMLLHTTFNGFLIGVSYYKSQLAEWGIGVAEQTHLPIGWLLTASVVAAASIFAIECAGRAARDAS